LVNGEEVQVRVSPGDYTSRENRIPRGKKKFFYARFNGDSINAESYVNYVM